MRTGDYLSLLASHRFRISPQRMAMACLIGGFSVGHSLLAGVQRLLYQRQIEQQAIDPAPLFVVGHWRSGTTLLHELLSLDNNFSFSSTVECFLPHHFLISEPWLKPFLRLLLPNKRPMDNMPTGVELPQEDEFALIGLGAPTPYLRIAFANDQRPFDCLLDMQDVPAQVEADFEKQLTFFLKSLMLKKQKRLILKSPTHTGRIGWLAKQYPGSRFVHISRNPIEVFLSTKRLWRRLDEVQGFQLPKYSDQQLETLVFDCYKRMYNGYFLSRKHLRPNQLIEIQFEQLTQRPAEIIQQVYAQLELGDSTLIQQEVAQSMQQRKNFEKADYEVGQEVTEKIMPSWRQYAQAFGYDRVTGKPLE